jgi:hypothetical protein
MSFESIQSLPENTPFECAQELAADVFGNEYDEVAMRQAGLDPFFDRNTPDTYKFRRWDMSEVDGEVIVSVEGTDYVYSRTEGGFRRVRMDDNGNPRGLGGVFYDSEGLERTSPKRYTF